MSNSVIVEPHGSYLIMCFNRPEIRSPLSVAVVEELTQIVERAWEKDPVPALIFTGVDGVFASGADLREIAALSADTAPKFALRGQRLMNKIASHPAPTIAAVNGFCFGGALDLALACRNRIASRKALFAHPGADLGIMTGWGGTQRLTRLIGEARALEIFFTARRVGAEEALRLGLIDLIAEDPLSAAITRLNDGLD